MTAVITGIGWVTASGCGWGTAEGRFSMPQGELPSLSRKQVFPQPNQRFGRQSDYSKTGLAAIAFALRDAGREGWTEKRPYGIVASTLLGCLATDLDYFGTVLPEGGGLPSPNLFAYTLANCFLGEAAIQFGFTGPTVVINEAGVAGTGGLRYALESLALGECGTVLAGICNLPAPPGFAAPGAPSPGALFMVLEADCAAPGYGRVSLEGTTLLFGDGPVTSLPSLAEACLMQGLPK